MVEIQKLTMSDIASDTLTVEITISDNPDLEQASMSLVGRLPVKRTGLSIENFVLDTLDQLRELIAEAANPIEHKIREQP